MVGQPKTIDVAMRENTSLLAESATTAGARLKVTWDDKELLHPRLIRLRVINSGRRIIRANDFDKNEALWITVHGAVIIAPDLLATAGRALYSRSAARTSLLRWSAVVAEPTR